MPLRRHRMVRAWFNTHNQLTGTAVAVAVAVAPVVPVGVAPVVPVGVTLVGALVGVVMALAWTGGRPLPPVSWAYVFESVWYWSPDIGTGSQQWNALALQGENPALTASAAAAMPTRHAGRPEPVAGGLSSGSASQEPHGATVFGQLSCRREARLYLRCNKLGASRSASAIGHSLHQWNGCHEQSPRSHLDSAVLKI
jgi:hypothetical protein